MVTPDGTIWTAITEGEYLRYYTNAAVKNTLPATIDLWRAGFDYKEVMYMKTDGAEAAGLGEDTDAGDITGDQENSGFGPDTGLETADDLTDEPDLSDEFTDENPGEEASDIANEDNNYFYTDTYSTAENDLMFSPQEVYYEDGKLIAVMYVYNGKDVEVFDITDIELTIGYGGEEYASGYFTSMENAVIDAKSYITWRFEFTEDAVKIQDADLTTLDTTATFTYSYY
jgi:SLAP domain-containing protein